MVEAYDEYIAKIKALTQYTEKTYAAVHEYEKGIRPIFAFVIHQIVSRGSQYDKTEGLEMDATLSMMLNHSLELSSHDEVYNFAF